MAGAAVRAGRRAVGVDADHFSVDVRNAIRAGDGSPRVDCRYARTHAQRVGSEIGDDARTKADYSPVAPGRELGVLDLIASMCGRDKALAPSFHPCARTARSHRQQRTDDVLGVKAELGAKAAANVGRDESQFVKRQAEAFTQRSRVGVRQLTRCVMSQPAGRAIEIRQHSAALECRGSNAAVDETAANDNLGFGESARNVATGATKSE